VRAIGFQLGQRGDLIISTATARAFKEQFPGSHLTLGIGPQFADMVDLFRNHPYYDDVHVYNSYDNWPDAVDRQYLVEAGYDTVFHGMPRIRHDWFMNGHQTVEVAKVYGLVVKDSSLVLTKWFKVQRLPKHVAFAPFAGYYSPNNDKRFSVEAAQAIVDDLIARGYKVVQLGGANEPRLQGAFFAESSYFESVRIMLGCDLLIHTDTGMGWVASAYKHPQLGLYGHRYYGADYVKNIQPINPNGHYLDANTVADISLDSIFQLCHTLLPCT
jgi:ADP-heptose:LPS heptosyltransferase